MRRRRGNSQGSDIGMSLADLFMNCFSVMLILMFLFMLNQGVKAVATMVDQSLLEELMRAQQQQLDDAEQRVSDLAAGHEQQRKKSMDEKLKLLEGIEQAEQEADDAKRDQAEGDAARLQLEEDLERLGTVVTKAREASSLRVDLLQDCTGSMSDEIGHAQGNAVSMTRALPIVLTEVEMGVIGFRDGKLAQIPIEQVKCREEDSGASIERVTNMVGRLNAAGGSANIEQAIRASMARMDKKPGAPRECLVVIGDVGPDEVSRDPAVAQQLVADVTAWCNQSGKDRRVLAFFSGGQGTSHETFFQLLGSINERSVFSRHSEELFERVLEATFSTTPVLP